MARRLSRDYIISNVYYNLEAGFGSIDETLKKAKEQDPSLLRFWLHLIPFMAASIHEKGW